VPAAVTPAELERAVHEAMRNPAYDWRLPPPPGSVAKPSWLISFADRIIQGVQSAFEYLGELLKRLFEWIFHRGTAVSVPGAPPSAGLHWSVWVLMGVVVLAAVWIVSRRLRSRRAPAPGETGAAAAIPLDADDLSVGRLPEEKWNELAEASLQNGNTRLALRAFYLASLAWLGRREFLVLHPGKTNREYELELRRRARAFPDARGLFTANVAAFERAWYGMHEVRAEEIGEFRGRVERMKSKMGAAV
jgi:hypothetical protein